MAADAYRELFANVRDDLPGHAGLRSDAMEGLAFPDRRDEAWRFTPSRRFLDDLAAPRPGSFVDLPEGVEGADSLRGTSLEPRLGRVAGTDGFAGLNSGFFTEVAVVRASGQTVRLTARHRDLSVPRVFVHAPAGQSVRILLEHVLEGGLAAPVVEIVVEEGAEVSLTQVVSGTGSFAGRIAVAYDGPGKAAVQSFVTGGDIVRIDLQPTLCEGARFDSSGLVVARGRAHADHHLDIVHGGADGTSTQVFRNILDDRARAVFTGQVTVARDVTGSDATQTANTLLLSDSASAVARPWLVIDNDDVTASHGATVGRLDPDALFYLRARGISALEARRLLTRAFAGEVVQTVPDAFRETIEAAVNTWLDGSSV